MDLTTIINFFKLPTKVTFLITIISTILLFSTQTFMERIALYQFKEKYTVWIGIVFLFTLGLSIINIYEYIREKLALYKNKKDTLELLKKDTEEYSDMLKNLDNDELINIREFYVQEKNTIQMVYNDSAIAGLVKKKVIHFVSKEGWSNTYTSGGVFLFELSKQAKEYFDRYDFTRLKSTPRPKWLNGIEASKKMEQTLENMQTSLMNNF